MITLLLLNLLSLTVASHPSDSLTLREYDIIEKILTLTGASSPEELDDSVMERFERLSHNPICINTVSVSRLSESGLFSPYQVATIDDYRHRNGDILSASELALVDGFSEIVVDALRPFVSFDSFVVSGRSSSQKPPMHQDFTLSATYHSEKHPAYRARYLCERDGRWEIGFRPESFDIVYYGRRHPYKVIVGDYNARFGQGLALWTGFSMSSLSTALSRNPMGLSPSHSYSASSSRRGMSAAVNFSHSTFSSALFISDKSIMPALNYTVHALLGQWGLTFVGDGTFSMDIRKAMGYWDFFAEFAADAWFRGSVAALCGVNWNPLYGLKMSALIRHYPKVFTGAYAGAVRCSSKVRDETGVTFTLQSRSLALALEALRRPSDASVRFRSLAKYDWSRAGPFSFSLRLTERFLPQSKPVFRTDLRCDLKFSGSSLMAAVRANAVFSESCGRLCYLEIGHKSDGGKWAPTVFARVCAFRADNWNDRLYVYERDAPGNFTVPAYYGRGCSASLYAALRYRAARSRRYSAYLRFSYMQRELKGEEQPAVLGLRLQLSVNI